jgi:hypothetical protein
MAEIKVFPIGYIASSNTNSFGNIRSGQLAASANVAMLEPNRGANKTTTGFTAVSNMENRAIWARRIAQYKHAFEYRYRAIWNHEFKPIRRFIREVAEFRANSFYLVDWSSGQKVTAVASGANWNASIYDTTDFSATAGQGGKYACLWYPDRQKFRIGIISSKVEDSSVTWPDSSDFGDLNEYREGKVFLYPMYRVYMVDDDEKFSVKQFADTDLGASFAGPVRDGKLKFIQRDVR